MLDALNNLKHKNSNNFFILAGPCAIEGEEMAFEIADRIKEICDKLKIPFIFKGSFRKANRSRLDSFTGIGDEKALKILKKIGIHFNIPTVTDIHTAEDAEMAMNNARDVYTRRNEGVSIWVVESTNITASSPDDSGSLFEPANDKVYRHPTFYELPDELKHM